MRTFTAPDGTRVDYRRTGGGPPLLCLPCAPPCGSDCLGDLGGLDAHRELVRWAPRGAAHAAPEDAAERRHELLASHVEALRGELNVSAVDLLAHRTSVDLAVRYASLHPERTGRLVLVAPSTALLGSGQDTRAAVAGHSGAVLVLVGERGGGPTPAQAAELAAFFPRGRSAVLPDAGPRPWREAPSTFVERVNGFLRLR